MIPGSARGAQALLGGSIHFGQIDGTALIAAINQGADLVFVASSLNKFPFSLVTQKYIRQPKDLIGKKVGIVSLGGAHEVSLILALREWNIPRQSVTLLASGPAANRLVGLSSRRARCDFACAAGDWGGGAHGTADSGPYDRAQGSPLSDERHRDAALVLGKEPRGDQALLAGLRRRHSPVYDKQRKGLAMLTQRMKQKNPAVVEETYQYFASTFSSPPRMSHDGMRAAIDMLQQRSPETKFDTNVSRYVDERLMDELEKEGFFKRMGGKS